eukprot:GHVT01016768.1.p1 GENE.GHVT01016768.1~~GHVT01016768.1.p1  ORF type:complete len:119 (+),score=11.47 GHVT01016768.1:105-461(+)
MAKRSRTRPSKSTTSANPPGEDEADDEENDEAEVEETSIAPNSRMSMPHVRWVWAGSTILANRDSLSVTSRFTRATLATFASACASDALAASVSWGSFLISWHRRSNLSKNKHESQGA